MAKFVHLEEMSLSWLSCMLRGPCCHKSLRSILKTIKISIRKEFFRLFTLIHAPHLEQLWTSRETKNVGRQHPGITYINRKENEIKGDVREAYSFYYAWAAGVAESKEKSKSREKESFCQNTSCAQQGRKLLENLFLE